MTAHQELIDDIRYSQIAEGQVVYRYQGRIYRARIEELRTRQSGSDRRDQTVFITGRPTNE